MAAAAHWTVDGSGVLAASGGAVRCVADAAGSKGNAVWGGASGSGHYTFRLSGPPGAWVGVCTQGGFAAGWRLRGLFYGGPGNLADGSSLVTSSWGPAFGEGDTIAMRVEQGAGALSLAFSKNGEPLGEAFNVPWAGEAVHPAVSLDTEGQGVELLAPPAAALPPLAAFLRPAGPAGPGIEGSWVGRYSLQVSSAGAGWRLSARVANTMNCRVLAGAGGASLQGRVSSTLMAPGPEDAALEGEVVRALEGITALRREGAELVLEGGGAQERFSAAPAPAPAGKDSVNWMN